jgi:hypothetical protein
MKTKAKAGSAEQGARSQNEESILEEALRISGGARQENYGHPLANHIRIAELWNGYLRARHTNADGARVRTPLALEPVDVVHMMILLKVARELHTSKRDNWTDMAGYARCGARIGRHEP